METNNSVVGCSEEKGCSRTFKDKQLSRNDIFIHLTKELTGEEKTLLTEVFGRDNELTFLCLHTSKILGLDILTNLRKIIQNRQSDESSSENYYLESLKEFLFKNKIQIFQRILKDGTYSGFSFYPKSRLYQDYVQYLKGLNIASIGTKKFSSMLRDLGFVEGDTIKSQRFGEYPTPCLIFSQDIKSKLGLIDTL